jgi:uncharacterized hydrophobic protein (TIGR00271 family)
MSSQVESGVQPSVRFSRVLGLHSVVALGASISVGLGVYVLLGLFVQVAGRQAVGAPYLFMGLLALPIILTYAERAAVIPGGGGAYNLARVSGNVPLTYAGGWLLLAGYASLVAILGWGVALHVNVLTEYLFELSLDLRPLAAAIIGVMALNSTLGSRGLRRSTRTYIYAALVFLLLIILRDILRPGTPEGATRFLHDSGQIASVAALMVASLWGLHFILNVRDEIQRPTQTILRGMLLTVGLGVGLGLLASLATLRYGALPGTLTSLLEMTAGVGLIPSGLLIILYAVFGLVISLIGLNLAVVNGLRLIGELIRDGFLPQALAPGPGDYRAPPVPLVLFALISILLLTLVPILIVVGLASITFLGSTALVHLPDALRRRPNLPEKRFPKLPFHPLFPWLTILGCLFLPLYLERRVWLYLILWVILGAGYYVLYARQGGESVRRREVQVGEPTPDRPEEGPEYCVLVGISNPKTAPSLLRAGVRLARARNGGLMALKVLCLEDQIPNHLKRRAAQEEWDSLAALVEGIKTEGITVQPLVRLAPDPTSGILEAVRQEEVDLLLLGWEGEQAPDEAHRGLFFDSIIKRAPCDVAVLRGRLPERVENVLVPTAGGPHAPLALTLGEDLVDPDGGRILAANMVQEHLTPEREDEARANLQTTLEAATNGHDIRPRVLEVESVKDGIVTESEGCDALLMGASKQAFLEQTFFGGLPVEVATATAKPTILTRVRETGSRYWLGRVYETITAPLPTLTLGDQVEVYRRMYDLAQPSADFFVLITLAAAIATLSLLQDSPAVVIGAMLVAPLMSPILAMAMAMVRGNMRLLRTAAEATTQGAVLAIAVGIAMTLISPISATVPEILARTEPNILDLMIALFSGAAAGYAVSRKSVASALPGVAIAVALVPPLCVVGYGLGISDLSIAAGALLLFITNLVATIFAGAVMFLALGFHPARTREKELERGLRASAISLGIVSIILAVATITTVNQTNRLNRVAEVLNEELVAQAAQVQNMSIRRDRGSFLIEAIIINFVEDLLTPEQFVELEQDLTQAAGGPVTVDAVVLPGAQTGIEGLDRQRLLEQAFEKEVEARSAEVGEVSAKESEDGFTITATVITFEDDELSAEEMAGIQRELSQQVEAPVAIEATILSGRRAELEALAPPTTTPQP